MHATAFRREADGVIDSHARITPALRAAPGPRSMHIAKGIALKLASLLLFAVMSALIRGFGDKVPVAGSNFHCMMMSPPRLVA